VFDWSLYLEILGNMLILALAAWVVSVIIRNVSIVDSLWSLFFVIAGVTCFLTLEPASARSQLLLVLLIVWAARLSIYITVRNWGEGEDYRYQAIRKRNEPGFVVKSLYIVFGLQAVLAWIVAVPLLPAMTSDLPFGILDAIAVALWAIGFGFEAIGDYQLSRFLKNPDNKGKVMQSGLWKYTRHPNYFGDCCVWWSFYLFAVAAGGWWAILSPILMTVLLLRISGVALLEKTIGKRRPEYEAYRARTSAFFPLPPKTRA
jgi:steroid 5-alpha reductase family enzyme